MNKYFKLVFVLIFVFSAVVAVALWQGLNTFVFAWVLNFMLMMGVLYFTQSLKFRLESTYYNPKKWEDEGKLYKWLGVHGFRKVLVWVGWEKLNKASNPVKKSSDSLIHLEYNTRQSEFGHLIILFIVFAITVFVGFYYGFKQTLWLLTLNILLNAYPIVVQRYNRPRLNKIINKYRISQPS